MDAQDFRSLQEAYMEVVENQQLDEISLGLANKARRERLARMDKSFDQDFDVQKYDGKIEPSTKTINHLRKVEKTEKHINKKQKTQKEQTDIYDIILSHLLDEGYDETTEAAEVIMVNMSEEWRESICEGYKKLPVGKMISQASRKTSDAHDYPDGYKETKGGEYPGEASQRQIDHINKMVKVADDHNPTKAKRKEEDNRRIGGRKRDAGRPRSNELQDNW